MRNAALLALVVLTSTAMAQSSGLQWVEDARILERPYEAFVGPGFYVTTDITIRAAQEPLWFKVNDDCVLRIEARVVVPRVDDWEVLNSRCVNAVRWANAPDEPRPARTTLPRDGGIRPAMIFNSVDLPQPLDPMTEEKLPLASRRSIPSSAWTLRRAKVLLTPRSS